MYSTREAMAYSGKLPEQQQSGITPDLIDLLAMQKVEDDKKAAASQMALAAGQPMPTIAESLKQKALESAKQEIAQKLGLPAALAQQQAPQGQAAMPPQAQASQAAPPPQQPPQAPQGVAAVQSNLPKSYSHGGILHYVGGGEAGMREQVGDVNQLSDSPEEVQQVISDLQSGKLQGAEREAAMEYLRSATNKLAGTNQSQSLPSNPQDLARVKRFPPNTPIAQSDNQIASSPMSYGDQGRIVLNPQEEAFKNQTMNMLSSRMNIDPEAARAAEEARIKAATGEHFQQAQEAKQQGLAALQALYAKDQSNRPSQFWQTINAIGAKGPNVMPGQWGAGVAEKVQGQNETYNSLDIARQTNVNNLNDAIQNAIMNNDLSIYNAGKAEFTRAENQIGTSAQSAATMADAILRFKTNDADRMARIAAEERMRGDALSQAKELAANKRMLDATAAADKAAMNDDEVKAYLARVKGGLMLPAEQQAAEARIEKIKQAYQERYLRAIGITPPAAPTATASNRTKFDAQGNPI